MAETLGGTPQNELEIKKSLGEELAKETGIPLDQITPEMVEKYQLAKSINAKLDLLAVSTEQDTIKKISKLHDILEKSETPENTADGNNTSIDFSSLSVASLKEQADKGIPGAKDFLEKKQAELTKIAEDKFKTEILDPAINGSIIGKIASFFGIEDTSSKILEAGKKHTSGFGKIILGFILSALGIKEGVDIFKKLEDSTQDDSSDDSVNRDNTTNEPTIASEAKEIIKDPETKKSLYANIGNIILLNVSGIGFEKNSNKGFILKQIAQKNWKEGGNAYYAYLKSAEEGDSNIAYQKMISSMGFSVDDFGEGKNKDTLLNVFEGVYGGVSVSIINEKITPENIQKLVSDGVIKKWLGEEYEQYIKSTNIDALTLKDISILIAIMTPSSLLESGISGVSAIKGYLFGDETGDDLIAFQQELEERKTNIFFEPKFITGVLTHSEAYYINQDKDSEFRASLVEKGCSLEDIEKLIHFKNTFIENINNAEKYTLGYTDFKRKLHEQLNYKEIISMYIFLNGNPDISNLGAFESAGIYYWISKLFYNDHLDYIGQLGVELTKTDSAFSEVEKAIIGRNVLRVGEKALWLLTRSNNALDAGMKTAIHEGFSSMGLDIQDETTISVTEWIIILGIIGGGSATMYIPHPAAKLIGFGIMLFGAQFGVYKLYDMGTFSKLKEALSPDAYDLLNTQMEGMTGKRIEELIELHDKGVSSEEAFNS